MYLSCKTPEHICRLICYIQVTAVVKSRSCIKGMTCIKNSINSCSFSLLHVKLGAYETFPFHVSISDWQLKRHVASCCMDTWLSSGIWNESLFLYFTVLLWANFSTKLSSSCGKHDRKGKCKRCFKCNGPIQI